MIFDWKNLKWFHLHQNWKMFKFSPQRKFVFSLKCLDHISRWHDPKGHDTLSPHHSYPKVKYRKLWGTHFLVPHGTIDRTSNMWWRLAVSLVPCYWHQGPHSSFTFYRLRLSSILNFYRLRLSSHICKAELTLNYFITYISLFCLLILDQTYYE